MNRLMLFLLGALSLTFSSLTSADIGRLESLPPESFGKCQFSMTETDHIKISKRSYGSSANQSCTIYFDVAGVVSGESTHIIIVSRRLYDLEHEANNESGDTDNGFFRDKTGNWHFRGTNFLLSPTKMLKTSFSEEIVGDDTLLVGHQLLSGYIAQGGPIQVPGIRIVRITPGFVVGYVQNFEPLQYEKQDKGYKKLREAISREIVDIVKGVRFTSGVAGPMARERESTP